MSNNTQGTILASYPGPSHKALWEGRGYEARDYPSSNARAYFYHYSSHVHFLSLYIHHSGDTLYIQSTHAFSLKSIGEIRTQCGNEMMSFSCN